MNSFLKKAQFFDKSGISLVEVLITVAILIVLAVLFFSSFGSYLEKSRDGRRKSDLEKIKTSFEDYYNDYACYPPDDILEDCNSEELKPYLTAIPCDPKDEQPYIYLPESDCKGYKVLSRLEYTQDPIIGQLGCTGGCGIPPAHPQYSESGDYVYGVAAGIPLTDTSGTDPSVEGLYVCSPTGCDRCSIAEGTCIAPLFETHGECVANTSCDGIVEEE